MGLGCLPYRFLFVFWPSGSYAPNDIAADSLCARTDISKALATPTHSKPHRLAPRKISLQLPCKYSSLLSVRFFGGDEGCNPYLLPENALRARFSMARC